MVHVAAGQRHAGPLRRRPDLVGARQPVEGPVGIDAVDHQRAQRQADPVGEGLGRLGRLVDRGLLGEGDQHHLGPVGVGQHLADLDRLGEDGTDAHGVEKPLRGEQEGDGVSGGGAVDDDHVGRPGPLQGLHLAENEDLPHAGHGGRQDVERSGAHQPLRHPPEAVGLQVLDQGLVGRQGEDGHPGVDLLLAADNGRSEHRCQPGLPLQLDQQRPPAGPGGGHGQGGGGRRFAHSALPGHDDHPERGAPLGQLHRLSC